MTAQQAFIQGLLHNIGSILLCNLFPSQFKYLCHAQSINPDSSIIDLEDMIFGVNHQDVGANVLDKWNLDDDLINSAKYHHAPSTPGINNSHIARLWLIDQYLARYAIGFDKEEAISEKIFSSIDVTKNEFEELVDTFMLHNRELYESLNIVNG